MPGPYVVEDVVINGMLTLAVKQGAQLRTQAGRFEITAETADELGRMLLDVNALTVEKTHRSPRITAKVRTRSTEYVYVESEAPAAMVAQFVSYYATQAGLVGRSASIVARKSPHVLAIVQAIQWACERATRAA